MKENVRTRMLTLRLNKGEYARLQSLYKKSKCSAVSQYVRKIILQEPVTVVHRNQSADEILSALIAIKNELNAIGNNFNQSVNKLHTLNTISEIKSWAIICDAQRRMLLKKAEETRHYMQTIYEQWSQK